MPAAIPVCSVLADLPPLDAGTLPLWLSCQLQALLFFEDGQVQAPASYWAAPHTAPLVGVLLDPPAHLVTRLYDDVLSALSVNLRVLILYIDGLSFGHYIAYPETMPYLRAHGHVEPVSTVYPPLTNPGMASLLTGALPCAHGIHTHKDRRPALPTLFGKALSMGKSARLIEADIAVLRTEVAPTLNAAPRQQSDQAVLACALDALGSTPDLMLVHFHGLDDLAHAGHLGHPGAVPQKLAALDGYTQTLCAGFTGRVFWVSDHGTRIEAQGGGHGRFCCQDMIVPYGTWDIQGDEACCKE